MGNTCSASVHPDNQVKKYMEYDFVKTPSSRLAKAVKEAESADDGRAEGSTMMRRSGHGGFYSTFNGVPNIPLEVLVEHYQPYEFPICPVINSHTQSLVKNSWTKIIATEYDCEDTASGKISGASYFYNHFFNQLFKRLADFSRIFPDIKTRADIFSKVMSFCISIRIEELELAKVKLRHLGLMHKQIIHHPYLFGIYASNLHSTIRHCLGEDATYDIMSAWLHLLSFIMRGLLPAYFDGLPFGGHFNGAVNAASVVTEKATEEVKNADEMRSLKKKLKSMNGTGFQSRAGCDEGGSHEPSARSHVKPNGVSSLVASPVTQVERLPAAPVAVDLPSTTAFQSHMPTPLSPVHERKFQQRGASSSTIDRDRLEGSPRSERSPSNTSTSVNSLKCK